jgi:hypothetical protein
LSHKRYALSTNSWDMELGAADRPSNTAKRDLRAKLQQCTCTEFGNKIYSELKLKFLGEDIFFQNFCWELKKKNF